MKLYDSTTAPNPRRVRIFLAEKGISIPSVQVDIGKAENRQPAYLAKNPMGGVPILELDDGTVLAETVAICRYFEEIQPRPPLMGTDAKDRAIVEMWNRRMELEVAFRSCRPSAHARLLQGPHPAGARVRRGVSGLRPSACVADGDLAEREFIAGPRFTIADITLLIGIDFGRVVKIGIQPDQKNLARWYEAVSSRPSAKA